MSVGDVEAIATGTDQSLALKQDGSVLTAGSNDYGQLGDGSNDRSNTFEQVIGTCEASPFSRTLALNQHTWASVP